MHQSPTLTWREVVDKNHCTLVDELTASLDSVFAAQREAENLRLASERERVKLATAESLNQILRRIRQAPSETAVLKMLAEATSAYAERVVVLAIENDPIEASVVARREAGEGDLTFDASAAGAIAAVIETKDPVVALASASEIPSALAHALAANLSATNQLDANPAKVYLFPLTARQEVVAIVLAAGTVYPPALELLCGTAGLTMEILSPPVPVLKALPAHGFVQIAAPALPAADSPAAPRAWTDLTAADQKLHLQAQRVARVKVAEMRLYHAEELRGGVASGSIYNALQTEIDAARSVFLQSFLSKSPTMVDYLHLELLRSLAHDDDRLLGEDYPGPMV